MIEPFRRTTAFKGNLDHLKAVMHKLARRHRVEDRGDWWLHEWPAIDHKLASTSIWIMRDFREVDVARCASIVAVETSHDQTSIEAEDGYDPYNKAQTEPIGARFEDLVDELFSHFPQSEAQREGDRDQAGGSEAEATLGALGAGASRPAWFPKKETTIEKWKKAYGHCLDLQNEYQDMAQYGELDDPDPTWAEYSDHLAKEMRWRIRSAKTIRRILLSGKNGWL